MERWKPKKGQKGLVWLAVAALLVPVLVRYKGKLKIGEKLPAAAEAQIPSLPRSGTFELKAGQDYIHTGIFFEAGDRIKYDQPEPKSFWIKNETKENLMVSKTLFVTQADRSGEVQLIPGPEDTRVSVTVVKRRKGSFPFS